MIQELLREAQQRVIEPLQEKNEFISKAKLNKKRRYFSQKLSEIWKDEDTIAEINKFEDEDIFEYPLAVVYFLYCCPMQLVAVIQDTKMIHEFWDFYLDEYPEIKFDGNIHKFYKVVKDSKNRR